MTKCTNCNKTIWPWAAKIASFCYPYVLSNNYQHMHCFTEVSAEFWSNKYSDLETNLDYQRIIHNQATKPAEDKEFNVCIKDLLTLTIGGAVRVKSHE